MTNEDYMRIALEEAKIAYAQGEVPIGAVVVRGDEVIASAHNTTMNGHDPTGHAELNAIRKACAKLSTARLPDCSLYVTVEPCSMCSGGIVLSRIKRLYIGARDPKAGGCVSLYNIVGDPRLNHRVEMELGLLEEECSGLMKQFFRDRRGKKINEFSEETQE